MMLPKYTSEFICFQFYEWFYGMQFACTRVHQIMMNEEGWFQIQRSHFSVLETVLFWYGYNGLKEAKYRENNYLLA